MLFRNLEQSSLHCQKPQVSTKVNSIKPMKSSSELNRNRPEEHDLKENCPEKQPESPQESCFQELKRERYRTVFLPGASNTSHAARGRIAPTFLQSDFKDSKSI